MLVTTAVTILGPLSKVTAEISYELASLPELFPTVWRPLRQRRNGKDAVEQPVLRTPTAGRCYTVTLHSLWTLRCCR